MSGGRTWWAHLQFTRTDIKLTILPKKIEDLRVLRQSSHFRSSEVIVSALVVESVLIPV